MRRESYTSVVREVVKDVSIDCNDAIYTYVSADTIARHCVMLSCAVNKVTKLSAKQITRGILQRVFRSSCLKSGVSNRAKGLLSASQHDNIGGASVQS